MSEMYDLPVKKLLPIIKPIKWFLTNDEDVKKEVKRIF